MLASYNCTETMSIQFQFLQRGGCPKITPVCHSPDIESNMFANVVLRVLICHFLTLKVLSYEMFIFANFKLPHYRDPQIEFDKKRLIFLNLDQTFTTSFSICIK